MSEVNFVDEFRAIMDTCRKESIPARARLLWIALFYLANDRARKNEQTGTWEWPDDFFAVNNAEMSTHCPLEKRAMLEARNRLKQGGYIDFRSGDNATKPAKYKLKYLSCGQWCKNAPQDVPQHVPQGAPQHVPQGVPQPVPYYINLDKGLRLNETDTHTNSYIVNSARARDRRADSYTDEKGNPQPCRYDSAFLTSERARAAVAQRIISQFFGDVDMDHAQEVLCDFLGDGMPPELAEDCVDRYTSMSAWFGHLNMLYQRGRYAEQREEMDRAKWARILKSDSAADWMTRREELREE